LKGLFGGSSSEEEGDAQVAENVPPRESEITSSSAPASSSVTPETVKKEKTETKDKQTATSVQNTIPLNINIVFASIPPMTVEEKRAARSKSVLPSGQTLYALTHD